MKKAAVTFFILITTNCYSQCPYLLNGDFEQYDACPVFFSQAWDMQIEHCLGWRAPTMGTSDYFNECAPLVTTVSVPDNMVGFQWAHSGKGYCGLYAYSSYRSCEYIQTTLQANLISGHKYEVSFYASCADNSSMGISFLGAYLGTDTFYVTYDQLNVTPQILPNTMFTDTLNWIKFSGTFTATGAEQYLTIGGFLDTLNVDTVRIGPNDTMLGFPHTYVYIDDVWIADITVLETVNVFTPNDDGMNDEWIPWNLSGSDLAEVIIYDRWGVQVYHGQLNTCHWDGTNERNGNQCSDGVYYFIITNEEKYLNGKGVIHLLRN
jgi:gliding motility-associated-like protein